MPTTFVIRLTPRWPFAPGTWAGPALQAIFLDLVRRLDAPFAEALHGGQGLKPYALGDLRADDGGGTLWTWHAMDERTREAMLAVLTTLPPTIAPLGVLCDVRWEPSHPAASRRSWAELWAAAERSMPLPSLAFVGTTTFRVHGADHPLPSTRLIVRALAERWAAHNEQALPADLVEAAERHLRVVTAEVTGHTAKAGNREVNGFRGQLGIALMPDIPSEIAQALRALFQLAPFCGVGTKTTMGLGTVLLAPPPQQPVVRPRRNRRPPLQATAALAPAAPRLPSPPALMAAP